MAMLRSTGRLWLSPRASRQRLFSAAHVPARIWLQDVRSQSGLALAASLTVLPIAPLSAVDLRWPAAIAITVSEELPNGRSCIPGPHDPARVLRQPGRSRYSSKPSNPLADIYAHCRFESQQEVDRASRRHD
jgi:hypothetical protein